MNNEEKKLRSQIRNGKVPSHTFATLDAPKIKKHMQMITGPDGVTKLTEVETKQRLQYPLRLESTVWHHKQASQLEDN